MKEIWNESCILSPSLICLDMCNLEREVKTLENNGIKMLHVDILDGHFSPSMPLGLDTVRQLRAKTDLFFDCHVMVTEQDFFVDELLDIGVDQIVFHGETQPHIDGMINRIHAKGVKTGVALKCTGEMRYSSPDADQSGICICERRETSYIRRPKDQRVKKDDQ